MAYNNEPAADNYLPGEVQVPRVNADTPANPEELYNPYDTNKGGFFDHLSRLDDKLIGAVEFNIDAAIAEAQNPADVSKPVQTPQFAFLPPVLQSWASRNQALFYTAAFAVIAFTFIQVLRVVRR